MAEQALAARCMREKVDALLRLAQLEVRLAEDARAGQGAGRS